MDYYVRTTGSHVTATGRSTAATGAIRYTGMTEAEARADAAARNARAEKLEITTRYEAVVGEAAPVEAVGSAE